METPEELEAMFEALVPAEIKDLPANNLKRPTFDRFGLATKTEVDEICEEWSLKGSKAANLWFIWENHPTNLARGTQQQGSDFIFDLRDTACL
jgi:hypothetical protein